MKITACWWGVGGGGTGGHENRSVDFSQQFLGNGDSDDEQF